ncbi:hypothetical protein QW060_24410 [Myroides ceti]|uniref:Maturase K n=1 Tax=Paenimyroides ceti TaxID=395087 RepID=A0ABT8D2B9_9FLAO|nr:hypothetical protein [Paenimyroides ceti]MDN3710048.1 hypothetical protein [Paenimyroides ceti]
MFKHHDYEKESNNSLIGIFLLHGDLLHRRILKSILLPKEKP